MNGLIKVHYKYSAKCTMELCVNVEHLVAWMPWYTVEDKIEGSELQCVGDCYYRVMEDVATVTALVQRANRNYSKGVYMVVGEEHLKEIQQDIASVSQPHAPY